MAFTVEDFRDLVQILDQKPEWLEELRRLVLTREVLELPQVVRELAGDLRTLTQRVEELAGDLRTLTQRVEEIAGDLRTLTQRVEEIAGDLRTLTERVDQLTKRMEEVVVALTALTGDMRKLQVDVGGLKGMMLEMRYRERAPTYLGRIVRRCHALTDEELETLLTAAVEQGKLTEEEADRVMLADVVVRGRGRQTQEPIYLVVEVSYGVGDGDVLRAVDRAGLLSRLGTPALPVVGGQGVIPTAAALAQAQGVWQIIDGHVVAPDAA